MSVIANQKWKEPQHTKQAINRAGDIIRDSNSTKEEISGALSIIDNWRASHAYPMHVFYMNLRRKAADRPDILVVERLKRLESITRKLKIEKGMALYRMQDLGGCRMVLPNLEDVYYFSESLKNSRIRHELKKINDYIINPKPSGYRSLHLIYKFHSDRAGKEIYNKYPMLIELQFRTHLQHIWATAVETFGLIKNQAIKSGQGDEITTQFFRVVSSLFAIDEGTPTVPGTSSNYEDLVEELKKLDKKTNIIETLRAIRVAVFHGLDRAHDKRGYYLLHLDYINHKLGIRYFMPSEFEEANELYDKYEEKGDSDGIDVVLVRADSFNMVKNAYPNYFMDIAEFTSTVDKIIH